MATPEGICILVVNEDILCSTLVAQMLQSCTYEVLMTAGRPLEALSLICGKKDSIKVVISNVHRVQSIWASDVLHCIKDTLNVPISFISPDDNKLELKDYTFGAYLLKSINNDITNVLSSAVLENEPEVMKVVGCLSQPPSSPPRQLVSAEGITAPLNSGNEIFNCTITAPSLPAGDHTITSMEITASTSGNQTTSEAITAPLPPNKETTAPPTTNQVDGREITDSSSQAKETTTQPSKKTTNRKPRGRPPTNPSTSSQKITAPSSNDQTEIIAPPPPTSQTTSREITAPSSSHQIPENDEGKPKATTKRRKEKARKRNSGDGDGKHVEKKPRKYRLFMKKNQRAREAAVAAANNEGSNPENQQQVGQQLQLANLPYTFGMSQLLHRPLGLNSATGLSSSSSSSSRRGYWNSRLSDRQPSWFQSSSCSPFSASLRHGHSSLSTFNPMMRRSVGACLGLRLTDDGRSLEFGFPDAPHRIGIGNGLPSSPNQKFESEENQSPNHHIHPSTSATVQPDDHSSQSHNADDADHISNQPLDHSVSTIHVPPSMIPPGRPLNSSQDHNPDSQNSFISRSLQDMMLVDHSTSPFREPRRAISQLSNNASHNPIADNNNLVFNQPMSAYATSFQDTMLLDRLISTIQAPPSSIPLQPDSYYQDHNVNSNIFLTMLPFAISQQNTMHVGHFATMQQQNPNPVGNEEELHHGLLSRLGNYILPPLQQPFASQYEMGIPFSLIMSVQNTQLPIPGMQQPASFGFNPPIYGDSTEVHTMPMNNILDGQAQITMPPSSGDNSMVGYHSGLLFSALASEQQETMVTSAGSSVQGASFQELLVSALPSAEQQSMTNFAENLGQGASFQGLLASALPNAEQETLVNSAGNPSSGASIQETLESGNSGESGSIQATSPSPQRILLQEVPSAPEELHSSWMDENYPFLTETGSPPRLDDAFFNQNR
ncbi:OLC1v1039066C1 [Oldenlandia corymbosa var. corymbosa]|uniref:OLC1v1039066C1 n=1 Tax=Oldenlandia corymbosa var. corymbosa TaxID=529605 RepID=A0AAV1D4B9_OLDCO|nr:OLC1v1039066C1 [Oldenlandia corymbosa var. corymbosa]